MIDLSNVKLGAVIPKSVCESAIGFSESSDPKKWSIKMLKLLGYVSSGLKKIFGREITVRCIQGELHVLTDSDAAAYNPRRFEVGLRMSRRAHRRLMSVDASKLSPEELSSYSKNVSNEAFKLAGLRRKPDPSHVATERTTPLMTFTERKKPF